MTNRKNMDLSLLLEMIFDGSHPPVSLSEMDSTKRQSTIRPTNTTFDFFEYYGKKAGLSTFEIMTLVVDTLALNIMKKESAGGSSTELATKRFFMLFENHDIYKVHINNIISKAGGNPLPVIALGNSEKFLEHYSSDTRSALAKIFGVNMEWLLGDANCPPFDFPSTAHRDFVLNVTARLDTMNSIPDTTLESCKVIVVNDNDSFDTTTNYESSYPLPIEAFLMLEFVLKIDSHAKITVCHPIAYINFLNREARIGLSALMYAVENNRYEKTTLELKSLGGRNFNQLKSGSFPYKLMQKALPYNKAIPEEFYKGLTVDCADLQERI